MVSEVQNSPKVEVKANVYEAKVLGNKAPYSRAYIQPSTARSGQLIEEKNSKKQSGE